MTSQSEEWLDELIPCTTGCASNADPADGGGYCSCGAEAQRAAILKKIEQEKLEAESKGQLQALMNVWANYDLEVKKRDLSSNSMPKGYRKMSDKELLIKVIGELQSALSKEAEK